MLMEKSAHNFNQDFMEWWYWLSLHVAKRRLKLWFCTRGFCPSSWNMSLAAGPRRQQLIIDIMLPETILWRSGTMVTLRQNETLSILEVHIAHPLDSVVLSTWWYFLWDTLAIRGATKHTRMVLLLSLITLLMPRVQNGVTLPTNTPGKVKGVKCRNIAVLVEMTPSPARFVQPMSSSCGPSLASWPWWLGYVSVITFI